MSISLQELSAATIQDFAGTTIYKRGLDYYNSGQVYDVNFDPEIGLICEVMAALSGDA